MGRQGMMSSIAEAPIQKTSCRTLLATFSLHVLQTFSNEELKDFVAWITIMPESKTATLKLENVKVTNSMIFIFEANLLCFSRIDGIPGAQLLCENEPCDFDWLLHPQPSLPSKPLVSKQENVPLNRLSHQPPKC
jgi:hypothetical protein